MTADLVTPSAANRVATLLGIGFLFIGVVGFFLPGVGGMHLTVTHDIIHLVTGAVSLWLGLKGSPRAAKTFCIVFGATYLLLGIAGFVAGESGTPSPTVPGPGDNRMLVVIRGMLELGTRDHIVNVLLGTIFLVGGLMTRTAPRTDTRTTTA